MKKTLVSVLIVLLLCLGIAPVLAGSHYVVASSPMEKVTLAPFIHVTNSTVTGLGDGIGYMDSVATINNGVLNGTFTNTTETNTNPTARGLNWISVYGSSQITINNTNYMSPPVRLYIYDSSQVTIINSTLSDVFTYNSSVVTANNCNITGYMVAYDNSRIYLSGSRLPYGGLSNVLTLYDNSYLNANNCTVILLNTLDSSKMLITNNSQVSVLNAGNFATGQITNNCTIGSLWSSEATNITVDNSTITASFDYGLVCNGGSLIINGTTPPTGLSNCRNTTTLTNGSYSTTTPLLNSVCALASSTVNITNNNTVWNVFAHASSKVYLQNYTAGSLRIEAYDSSSIYLNNASAIFLVVKCTDYSNMAFQNSNISVFDIYCLAHSSLSLQNVNASLGAYVHLADQSSGTLKNSNTLLSGTDLTLNAQNQSTIDVEYVNFTGTRSLVVNSYDSSVVNILNVSATGGAMADFYGYDLSVMTINNSLSRMSASLRGVMVTCQLSTAFLVVRGFTQLAGII
ncbi:MAG: hypothetical protein WED07_01855 [Candidatus Freyarchaeum deiterrae]